MGMLFQDVKYGLRMLAKNPGFTAVAVLTLALGIGANTAIFGVINASLLKKPPFPASDRLALVWATYGGPDDYNIVSMPNYVDFKQQSHSFESIGLFDSAGKGYNLSSSDKEPEQVSGLRVTASFFDVLGVKPLLGRTFLPEEETLGKDREVVLSFNLWHRRYGRVADIVGKTIKVDAVDYTVVGVMPSEFEFQFWSRERELWVPAGYTEGDKERGSNSFVCVARLKPGVSVDQAKAEMATIGHRLAAAFPKDNTRMGATVTPLDSFGLEGIKRAMVALLVAVGFVLLIACANVANLMLARNAAREKELAVRRALGAGRLRITRQLLTESVILSLLGGIAGLVLAAWANNFLSTVLPHNLVHLPFRSLNSIPLDGRVFVFALVVATLTGILFGLAPAINVFRSNVNNPLKESGRGSTPATANRLRGALVATEVALALIVLCGAGLMIQSMSRLLGVDPGLNPKNVLTMDMSLPQINLYYGPPVDARFCHNLDQRVGALSGVVSASAISHLPLAGGSAGRGFTIEGRPDPGADHQLGANYAVTCPNYFRTMGIPLLKGREFTHQDTLNAPGVIVINETMANRYWSKQDPIGKRIKLGHFDSKASWMTVVGVFRDVRHWGLDEQVYPEFMRPYTQAAWPFMTVVVRTQTSPGSFTGPIKKAMLEVEPDQPVSGVQTMEEIVRGSLGPRRFPMLLLSAFAGLALILAAVGISGVVGYSVAQRTHEIGIRMALGAQRADVLRLVVGGGAKMALAGVAVGIVGAFGLTRFLSSLLFDIKPYDPTTFALVSLLLTAVALLASYLPSRRATKVDPMVALRYE